MTKPAYPKAHVFFCHGKWFPGKSIRFTCKDLLQSQVQYSAVNHWCDHMNWLAEARRQWAGKVPYDIALARSTK